MQATPRIHLYPFFGAQHARQIAYAILLALLLHALVLIAFYFKPSGTLPVQRQTIDVTLDAASPSSPPVPEKRPPPKPQPMPEKAPAITPAPQPAPPVAEAPPQQTPVPAAAPSQNSAPHEEAIQPLFRLTRMPSFSRQIEAAYPASERRAGIQANVLAEVTIDSQGKVLNVRILKSGGDTFDEAVKQALQKSAFNPGMIDGKPVGTRFQVPFRFNLS